MAFFPTNAAGSENTRLDLGDGVGTDFWELRNYFKKVLVVDINFGTVGTENFLLID